jgi:hypothetical protein
MSDLAVVVGVLGTLAGVTVTQFSNSRLDARRWARERERQRELDAREDVNRIYEHRRAVYVDFLREFERLRRLYVDGDAANKPAISKETFEALSDLWTAVTVYGTNKADELAYECLTRIETWAREPDNDNAAEDALDAWHNFLIQIRRDLDVPGEVSVRSTGE